MRRWWSIGIAVALALAGSAVALAAIPDSGGVIHGCYRLNNPNKGSIIVIDSEAGQSCPSGYTPLNWNQTGPQGPAGISGYEIVSRSHTIAEGSDPDFLAAIVAFCPAGKKALGGGGDSSSPNVVVWRSKPARATFDADGWNFGTRRIGEVPGGYTITAWALCATVNA